jgi:cation diffusion facilitator CzcD-associated flavoprotein CzcO
MERVAIIGAGPAGLAAARYLKSEGFEPTLFERASRAGGQWSGDATYTSVWQALHTNTSRILTSFSDLSFDAGTPVYPSNQQVTGYLDRYATIFGLHERARLGTRVEGLSRNSDRWIVRSCGPGGATSEPFDRVVVATGRYHRPHLPDVPGLQTFSGPGGAVHARDFKDAARYRGHRVLVAGCAISALEIASDVAMMGAERVVTTQRRQRYVLQKLMAGVPVDHLAFTRAVGMAARLLPMDANASAFKRFILRGFGSPAQLGAPAPADGPFDAGITLCQHFMPLVAEGRITIKPWIAHVDGDNVSFADGTVEGFDAIIFATGYQLELPFLDPEITRTLDADEQRLDLYNFTFHPDLPGLAFMGMFHQMGPIFPVLELQARYIAYTWSGARASAPEEEQRRGIAAYRAARHLPQGVPMHVTAGLFAGAADVEPVLPSWKELARPLLFGPLLPISYRLDGRDRLAHAAAQVREEARAFGAVPSLTLTPEQRGQLQALAAAARDPDFAHFVGEVTEGE